MSKKSPEKQDSARLRQIAARDPGLLEVLEEVKAAQEAKNNESQGERRLRMPYVSAPPITESRWK